MRERLHLGCLRGCRILGRELRAAQRDQQRGIAWFHRGAARPQLGGAPWILCPLRLPLQGRHLVRAALAYDTRS